MAGEKRSLADAQGHAFISYVREDAQRVDHLQVILEQAGIKVWRDTADIWPGQDWKLVIRDAITAGSLVFLACFSKNGRDRADSYQDEEVGLAAEQMRVRRPGAPWLIPVRFDRCSLPSFDLGAGRTLDSLQRADLFGPGYRAQAERLVRAIQQILAGEMQAGEGTRIAQPPVLAAVRFSLPPSTAAFTGREGELGLITAAGEAAMAGGVVAIHAIGGMPGVGKTALAVHVAHLLRSRFPDRQLFIDLQAHTPGQEPVPPVTALAGLLTAIGMDARYLPGDLRGLTDLWRDRMAGQHALLVLDNAASSDQVAPLLPGGDNCLVLVTSRRYLGDLPGSVVPVLLDVLPPAQAQEMFVRLAPRAAAGPTAAVSELAELTGYLPLAISLLARVYERHPCWTLVDLVAETRASLLTLAAEKSSVAAAFGVSYRYLAGGQQRLFRLLGLHPGTTIDAHTAAVLAGSSVPEAGARLDALHGEGLLTEAGYRRYGMHDLIRRYAQDLGAAEPAADRQRTLDRLLDYYQHAAWIAQGQLAQYRTEPGRRDLPVPADAVPDLRNGTLALAWARAERANLRACLDHVARAGQHERVIALTAAMAALWRQDGPWPEATSYHSAAVRAARDLGDQPGEALALYELGVVGILSGDYQDAVGTLGGAYAIYSDLGDHLGQANTLYDLGVVLWRLGDRRVAIEAFQMAAGSQRDTGDRLGEANSLNCLAAVLRQAGDYAGAADTLQTALRIYHDLGDMPDDCGACDYGAIALRQRREYPGAPEMLETALRIYRGPGERPGQAGALSLLAGIQWRTGEYQAAIKTLQAALRIYDDAGNRLGQASTIAEIGVLRRWAGDYQGAATDLEAALAMAYDMGDRGAVAEFLNEMGTLHLVSGNPEQAARRHQEALDLGLQLCTPWDQAHALAGLGRCALAAGNAAGAHSYLRQAHEIFQRIGATEATGIAIELRAIAPQQHP